MTLWSTPGDPAPTFRQLIFAHIPRIIYIQQGINRISFTPYYPPSWTFLSVLPRGCFPLTKTNSGHQLLIMITEPHLHWLRSFCPYELQPMGNHFSCISKSNSAFGHLQSHQESAHWPHPAASTTLPALAAGDCESRCRWTRWPQCGMNVKPLSPPGCWQSLNSAELARQRERETPEFPKWPAGGKEEPYNKQAP